MDGFVYFIRCGDYVKIGFSKNPSCRLGQFNTSSPYKCELISSYPGTDSNERTLHGALDKYRIKGEWFLAHDYIIDIANNYVERMPYIILPETKTKNIDRTHGFCADVRAARARAGWTQADLAAHCGLTRDGVKVIEAGRGHPRQRSIDAIKAAFEAHGIVFHEAGAVGMAPE